MHNLGLTYSKYKSLKSPQDYVQMLQKQARQLNTNDDNSITATKLECVIAQNLVTSKIC